MAARKDTVEISIAFLTDESRQYAKLVADNQQFIKDLKAAQREGKDLSEVVNKIAQNGEKVAKIPLDKLAPAQLIERAKQLRQVLDLIPQSAPQYKALEAEYKSLNNQLATMRERTKGITEAQQSAGRSIVENFLGPMTKVAVVITIITTAWELFKKAIGISSEIEKTKKQFEAFLGSAEKADAVMGKLSKFANAKLLPVDTVFQAGKALLAFGEDADNLTTALGRIGEISAGTGKNFNELAIIYGKARVAGVLYAEDINQLVEAGVPIIEQFAKQMGVSTAEVKKLASEGKIGFAELELAFATMTASGGKFSGQLQKQAESLQGTWTAIKSLFNEDLKEIGDWANKYVLKPLATAFLNYYKQIKGGGSSQADSSALNLEGREEENAARRADQEVEILEKKAKEAREKLAASAKKQNEDIAKKALDAKLKSIEVAMGREEIALEKQRMDKRISESDFAKSMLLLAEQQYEQEIAALEKYHQTETKQYIEAQKKLLDVRAQLSRDTLTATPALPTRGLPGSVASTGNKLPLEVDTDEANLRDKFRRQVINEMQYNEQLAALRISDADQKLAMLRENGMQETAIFKETLDEKIKAQQAFSETVIDNEKRTADLKKRIHDGYIQLSKDSISFGIELLSRDEKSRKKHGAAIKALELGNIAINLTSEIQSIWRWAHANAINGIIPGWAIIQGTGQSALAVGRATVASAKVASQKFFFGGPTGPGYGLPDETGARPAGIVHENEWVAPAWMVRSPIFNQTIVGLESARRRGYAAGGMVDTTPVSDTAVVPGAAGSASAEANGLRAEFAAMRQEITSWARNLRVKVVYSDIEEAGTTLADIQAEVSI